MAVIDRDSLLAVAAQALRAWDLPVSRIELVSRSENIVFRVETDAGEPFVLRLHRPGYHTLAALHAEQLWTAGLNQAGIHAPVHRGTVDGRGYATASMPGGRETRYAGLIEWVEGVPLTALMAKDDDASLLAHFEQVGRIAAQIHNQATIWPLPPGFQRHALDAEGLMGEQPFWGRFWEIPQLSPGERRQIARAHREIHRILTAYGKHPNTYSLIHADLHPGNLIVAPDRVHVIDFDDSGFGWHQYELAVALFYYLDDPRYPDIAAAVIRGYQSERSLAAADLALLPIFLLTRCLALLGWIHDRPELHYEHRLPGLVARACQQADDIL